MRRQGITFYPAKSTHGLSEFLVNLKLWKTLYNGSCSVYWQTHWQATLSSKHWTPERGPNSGHSWLVRGISLFACFQMFTVSWPCMPSHLLLCREMETPGQHHGQSPFVPMASQCVRMEAMEKFPTLGYRPLQKTPEEYVLGCQSRIRVKVWMIPEGTEVREVCRDPRSRTHHYTHPGQISGAAESANSLHSMT